MATKKIKKDVPLTEGKTKTNTKTLKSKRKPTKAPPAATPKKRKGSNKINELTTKFTVTNILCVPSHKGMKNFVQEVHYIMEAEAEDGVKGAIGGKMKMELPEEKIEGFKSFNKITSKDLETWMFEIEDRDVILAGLNNQIMMKRRPTLVSMKLNS